MNIGDAFLLPIPPKGSHLFFAIAITADNKYLCVNATSLKSTTSDTACILDGMLQLMPSARVGHIGLYRDPHTLTPVEYYFKVPHDIEERDMIVVDPMVATGNSAIAAVDRLKETNPKTLKLVCLLAAPEGIANFHDHHPDVPIYTAAIDECLDEHGYIIPGLGDAGDRLFGTK